VHDVLLARDVGTQLDHVVERVTELYDVDWKRIRDVTLIRENTAFALSRPQF
jgi:hypothetical protein